MAKHVEVLAAVAQVLADHGSRFAGNNVEDEAQEWLDHNFDAAAVHEWCEVGCWDAATAAELRDAGLSAEQASKACEELVDGMTDDERRETYTDGDPMYSCCNGDTSVDELVKAAK